MRRQCLVILFSLLAVAGLGPRTLAAQPTPEGAETMVSSGMSDCPRLGVGADGSFELAWTRFGQPSFVMARHYDASGSPTDPAPVRIGSLDSLQQVDAVTPVSDGFRVLTVLRSSPPLHSQILLDLDGAPEPEGSLPVGDRHTSWVWNGPGDTLLAGRSLPGRQLLQIQRVSTGGRPSRPFSALNTRPIEDPLPVVQVTPLADGGWIAVWYGTVKVDSRHVRPVMRARRFSAAGRALGQDFDVSDRPSDLFLVAANPSGGFAIVWATREDPPIDPNSPWVVTTSLRFFDAAARPRGPETVVAREQSSFPISAAFDGSGHLLLLWHQEPSSASNLQARLFGSGGEPAGPAFDPASSASAGFGGQCGSVAWTGDSWELAWLGMSSSATDGALFLRRFRE